MDAEERWSREERGDFAGDGGLGQKAGDILGVVVVAFLAWATHQLWKERLEGWK